MELVALLVMFGNVIINIQVTERYDLTSDEIISEVDSFSQSAGHGQMVALVIQAHGDTRGNILGVDNSPCSVQKIVDALCSPQLRNIPKVKTKLSFLNVILVVALDKSTIRAFYSNMGQLQIKLKTFMYMYEKCMLE